MGITTTEKEIVYALHKLGDKVDQKLIKDALNHEVKVEKILRRAQKEVRAQAQDCEQVEIHLVELLKKHPAAEEYIEVLRKELEVLHQKVLWRVVRDIGTIISEVEHGEPTPKELQHRLQRADDWKDHRF